MNAEYIGSDFDQFLEEEGILQETELVAIKRVLAMKIEELMKEKKLSKTELAKMMNTSRSSVDRLLNPENSAITLQTMNRAALVLGKRLHLTLV